MDGTWQKMKSATQFDEGEYFALIEKCLALDSLPNVEMPAKSVVVLNVK